MGYRGTYRLPNGDTKLDTLWMKYGLCRWVEDPDIFFPEGGSGQAAKMRADQSAAIKVCNECPVQRTCLEYALTTRQDNGVWGGTTERERKRILKVRARRKVRDTG